MWKNKIEQCHPTEYRTQIYKKSVLKTIIRRQYTPFCSKISKKQCFWAVTRANKEHSNLRKKTKKTILQILTDTKKQLFLALPDLFTPPKSRNSFSENTIVGWPPLNQGIRTLFKSYVTFWISVLQFVNDIFIFTSYLRTFWMLLLI